MGYRILINERFMASLTIKYRDWNSPCSLARYTPISTIGNHIMQTSFSPRRGPLNALNFLKHFLPKRLNRSKPLLRRTENDRLSRSEERRVGKEWIATWS